MTQAPEIIFRRLRAWTAFFIFGLVVSGLTAIPLETELAVLARLAGQGTDGFAGWIHRVAEALRCRTARPACPSIQNIPLERFQKDIIWKSGWKR